MAKHLPGSSSVSLGVGQMGQGALAHLCAFPRAGATQHKHYGPLLHLHACLGQVDVLHNVTGLSVPCTAVPPLQSDGDWLTPGLGCTTALGAHAAVLGVAMYAAPASVDPHTTARQDAACYLVEGEHRASNSAELKGLDFRVWAQAQRCTCKAASKRSLLLCLDKGMPFAAALTNVSVTAPYGAAACFFSSSKTARRMAFTARSYRSISGWSGF